MVIIKLLYNILLNKTILLFIILVMCKIQVLPQQNQLFSSDSTLKLTIRYYSNIIFKDREKDSKYHQSTMDIIFSDDKTKTFDIQLKTRGIFRLKSENCYFPPLTIKFDKKQVENTIFENNSKIKLTLPCRKNEQYQQYILLEYLAYKIYNLLTDYSYKVKLVKVRLIDISLKEPEFEKYGFFIEPLKSLENRKNGKEIETKNIHPEMTDRKLMNLLSIFEYMVGNTDWSVKALHNIDLLARDSLQNPVAIPFDFDFSGLVNAPYASPAETLNISSVRQRHYNGYYREFPEIMENVKIFIEKKSSIYQLVKSIEGLKKQYIDETIKYFDQFYKILDDNDRIKREFIEKCRKD